MLCPAAFWKCNITTNRRSSFVWLGCVCLEGELSPCRHMNGGCGDLCLLTPNGRVNCTCRGERVLLDDNRCVCKSNVIIDVTNMLPLSIHSPVYWFAIWIMTFFMDLLFWSQPIVYASFALDVFLYVYKSSSVLLRKVTICFGNGMFSDSLEEKPHNTLQSAYCWLQLKHNLLTELRSGQGRTGDNKIDKWPSGRRWHFLQRSHHMYHPWWKSHTSHTS